MDKLLAQIILAARNEDAEGWMNTLVVVLLAVFWAIGGILKARAKKIKAETEEEEPDEISETAISRGKARSAPVPAPQPKAKEVKAAVKIAVEQSKKPMFTPKKAEETTEKPAIEPRLFVAEEPGELKKAILHYEILGKPVSLRESKDEGLR